MHPRGHNFGCESETGKQFKKASWSSRFPWPQGRVVKVEFYLQGPEKAPLPLRHRQGLLMLPGMRGCFFGARLNHWDSFCTVCKIKVYKAFKKEKPTFQNKSTNKTTIYICFDAV